MWKRRPVTEVPDVVGLEATDACAIVRAAELVPYGPDYTEEPSTGIVTDQRPVGAAGAEAGSPVFLWTMGHRDRAETFAPEPVEAGTLDPV